MCVWGGAVFGDSNNREGLQCVWTPRLCGDHELTVTPNDHCKLLALNSWQCPCLSLQGLGLQWGLDMGAGLIVWGGTEDL